MIYFFGDEEKAVLHQIAEGAPEAAEGAGKLAAGPAGDLAKTGQRVREARLSVQGPDTSHSARSLPLPIAPVRGEVADHLPQ